MKTVVITGSSRGLGLEMAKCLGSKLAMEQMIRQGHGAIYNPEGYGSNDAMMLGLNMYGTGKLIRKFMSAGFNKRDFFS